MPQDVTKRNLLLGQGRSLHRILMRYYVATRLEGPIKVFCFSGRQAAAEQGLLHVKVFKSIGLFLLLIEPISAANDTPSTNFVVSTQSSSTR